MSQLLLVRHAQASFLESDYDVLSELGHAQARQLGERWAGLRYRMDAVYVGPRRRQQHTADLVGAVLASQGVAWPEPTVLDELDEYRAETLARELPRLTERPDIGALVTRLQAETDPRGRARAFERAFQAVMRLWQSGEIDGDGIESWQAFSQRVASASSRVMSGPGPGRRVAVFTSGGVIGVIVAAAVQAPASMALELGWTLQNASVTELLFSRQRQSLSRFNDLGHLADPSTWTYR